MDHVNHASSVNVVQNVWYQPHPSHIQWLVNTCATFGSIGSQHSCFFCTSALRYAQIPLAWQVIVLMTSSPGKIVRSASRCPTSHWEQRLLIQRSAHTFNAFTSHRARETCDSSSVYAVVLKRLLNLVKLLRLLLLNNRSRSRSEFKLTIIINLTDTSRLTNLRSLSKVSLHTIHPQLSFKGFVILMFMIILKRVNSETFPIWF